MRSLGAKLRRDWPLLVMMAPAALLLLVFHYVPTLGNVIAFQDYNPFAGSNALEAFVKSEWIGFGNFETLFADPAFWDAVVNTLTITAFQLVFFFPLPIVLAILLHSLLSQRLRAFIQGVVYLPHFFSWVLVVTFFVQMLGGAGLLAQELHRRGVEPWNIMTNPDTFIVLVTAEAVWKDVGWGSIVFLAALSTIDPTLYEAAAADGAGRWRRLWHITLPGLRPVIVLLLILRLGDALNVGFEQFLLQRDAVGRQAAEVLDTFVYYQAIVPQQWGVGAAAGLFKAVVGLVLILAANGSRTASGSKGCTREHERPRRSPTKSGGAAARAGLGRETLAGARLGKGPMLTLVVLAVLFPMWSILVTSLASRETINATGGMVVIPREFDVSAYVTMFSGGQVTRALGVSLFVTLVGTALTLVLTVLAAYGLSRPGSLWHRPLLFYFLLTFLIYPGLVPSYLVVTGLGLKDSLWALIVPSAVSVFNLVVVRAFFMSIPGELLDSARIDGASECGSLTRSCCRCRRPWSPWSASSTRSATGTRISTRCCSSTTTTSGRSSGCCRATSSPGSRRGDRSPSSICRASPPTRRRSPSRWPSSS